METGEKRREANPGHPDGRVGTCRKRGQRRVTGGRSVLKDTPAGSRKWIHEEMTGLSQERVPEPTFCVDGYIVRKGKKSEKGGREKKVTIPPPSSGEKLPFSLKGISLQGKTRGRKKRRRQTRL